MLTGTRIDRRGPRLALELAVVRPRATQCHAAPCCRPLPAWPLALAPKRPLMRRAARCPPTWPAAPSVRGTRTYLHAVCLGGSVCYVEGWQIRPSCVGQMSTRPYCTHTSGAWRGRWRAYRACSLSRPSPRPQPHPSDSSTSRPSRIEISPFPSLSGCRRTGLFWISLTLSSSPDSVAGRNENSRHCGAAGRQATGCHWQAGLLRAAWRRGRETAKAPPSCLCAFVSIPVSPEGPERNYRRRRTAECVQL